MIADVPLLLLLLVPTVVPLNIKEGLVAAPPKPLEVPAVDDTAVDVDDDAVVIVVPPPIFHE